MVSLRFTRIHLHSFGLIWIHLDSHGFIWIHLDSLGFGWVHLDSLGRTWSHLDSLGFTWIHLDSHGFKWIDLDSLGSHGCTWIHLESLGSTWIHLDSLGFTWIHLDSLGFTWTHLDSLEPRSLNNRTKTLIRTHHPGSNGNREGSNTSFFAPSSELTTRPRMRVRDRTEAISRLNSTSQHPICTWYISLESPADLDGNGNN